jgi:hypothetical protein
VKSAKENSRILIERFLVHGDSTVTLDSRQETEGLVSEGVLPVDNSFSFPSPLIRTIVLGAVVPNRSVPQTQLPISNGSLLVKDLVK